MDHKISQFYGRHKEVKIKILLKSVYFHQRENPAMKKTTTLFGTYVFLAHTHVYWYFRIETSAELMRINLDASPKKNSDIHNF